MKKKDVANNNPESAVPDNLPRLIEGLRRISEGVTALADALEGSDAKAPAIVSAAATEKPAAAIPAPAETPAAGQQEPEQDPLQTMVQTMAQGMAQDMTPTTAQSANEAPAAPVSAKAPAPAPAKEAASYTMQDVRKILADKSREGYTDRVKAILEAHGANKLSALPESEYAAVVREAEALDG